MIAADPFYSDFHLQSMKGSNNTDAEAGSNQMPDDTFTITKGHLDMIKAELDRLSELTSDIQERQQNLEQLFSNSCDGFEDAIIDPKVDLAGRSIDLFRPKGGIETAVSQFFVLKSHELVAHRTSLLLSTYLAAGLERLVDRIFGDTPSPNNAAHEIRLEEIHSVIATVRRWRENVSEDPTDSETLSEWFATEYLHNWCVSERAQTEVVQKALTAVAKGNEPAPLEQLVIASLGSRSEALGPMTKCPSGYLRDATE